MPADPQEAITLIDAVKFLGPLVGSGGVTAIVIAWIGSRRPKPPPVPDVKPAQLGIQALLADHLAMERLIAEIKRLADAAQDLAKAGNRLGDMMDIARAVERLTQHRD